MDREHGVDLDAPTRTDAATSPSFVLSFGAATLPADWTLEIGGHSRIARGNTCIELSAKATPIRVAGSWHGKQFFTVLISEARSQVVEVQPLYLLEVVAPPAADYARWVHYECAPAGRPRRDAIVTKRPFDERGIVTRIRATDQTARDVIWMPGVPLFAFESDDHIQAWSTRRVLVQQSVSCAIAGRVTDQEGRALADVDVRLTRLFPESWSSGDWMVLDESRARGFAGFVATVRTDHRGSFQLAEVGPEARQPFLVELPGSKRRVLAPTRALHTTAGGTWVDVLVE